jgi:hypothetical protein
VTNHATMERVKGLKATILIQRVLRHFTMIRPESSTRSVQSASPTSTSVIAPLGRSRQTSKAPSASRFKLAVEAGEYACAKALLQLLETKRR